MDVKGAENWKTTIVRVDEGVGWGDREHET